MSNSNSNPEDPAAEQAGHVLMWHAVAIKNHGLSSSDYEVEVTDTYGNTIKMKGTMYGPDLMADIHDELRRTE